MPESPLEALIEQARADLQTLERDIREHTVLMNQSKAEVDKLAQRNATAAAQLRQMQLNLENTPRADIKAAYEAAQDAQQRLLAMRGQLERLQSDANHLDRLANYLRQVIETAERESASKQAELAAKADGKTMLVRIIEAQESERQKLSKQIHDGPAQAMSNFILQTEIAARLFQIDQERARAELQNMRASATTTFQKIRDFIADLRPMMLDDLGLAPTVRRYLDSQRDKENWELNFKVGGAERRIEQVREVLLFRGIQELLHNVRTHAQASQVTVALDMDSNRVRVTVEDNGKGFDPATVLAGRTRTIGLAGLRERLGLLGGQLVVESEPGQGTRVIMELPVGESGGFDF